MRQAQLRAWQSLNRMGTSSPVFCESSSSLPIVKLAMIKSLVLPNVAAYSTVITIVIECECCFILKITLIEVKSVKRFTQ